ncbi:hypothetical protein SteCoe_16294 [Stentor coeruleus]|uniref:Metallo-beta-lactamase domain-containing protein n=1 Tax=Stentor coeruleus TaxID=5963 RepID=A0A1R2C1N4_9CILI|nr:hypothetical protein SteCoe_16294 [Stentor coeruleus]
MFTRLAIRRMLSAIQKPQVECVFHDDTNTCCYIASCNQTGHAIVIDSVFDYDPINHRTSTTHADKLIDKIKAKNMTLDYILESHVHADHLTGAQLLKKAFPNAKSAIGFNVVKVQETFSKALNLKNISLKGLEFDLLLKNEDKLKVGNMELRAIHTPGHTPACMVYVLGDAVFTGDTIFMPDFGTARCDFPGASAEQLYDSIRKIFELPETNRVFVGHDYGTESRKVAWETTVHAEKHHNKQMNMKTTKEDFVAWRKGRDAKLSLPKLIFQSLQVNLRNGLLPEPDSSNVVYFRIPINLL